MESQEGRKFYRLFGFLTLVVGIFIIAIFVVSKSEISGVRNEVQELKDQIELLKKRNDFNNSSDSDDVVRLKALKEQIDTLKKSQQQFDQKISNGRSTLTQKMSTLENQFKNFDDRTHSFFNYKVIPGTNSAFFKFDEKMNFKVIFNTTSTFSQMKMP